MKKSKRAKSEANAQATAPEIEIEERIRQRAYELWELGGRVHGCDMEHWLQAKVEILGPGSDEEVPQ